MKLPNELKTICDANRNMSTLLLALSEDIAEASKYQCLVADICETLLQDAKEVDLQKEYHFSKSNRLLPFLVYAASPNSQKLVGAFATEEFAMDFVDSQKESSPNAEYVIKTFLR